MENRSDKTLLKVKLRVEEIKKFYKHVVTYILVNLFLAFVWNFSFKIFGDFKVSINLMVMVLLIFLFG